ncbi:DUF3298 and DUF4163 domain-containing protein [Caldalkalibacillus salinus]|uniref:DUF3298 and DUF4163 domain-containing protein n=1 Tax=Caldalkalibacillus salinus TaxID=2803787 RepID=UPI00192310D3|nr:DUF3298 and DUF4163 domain-containing protein [Caldalkalibacillus salinus]
MNGVQLPVLVHPRTLSAPHVEITYPEISGTHRMAQERINAVINRTVHELIRDQGYYHTPHMEMTGTFEIKTNERGILSLTLSNYAYAPGAAHGLTLMYALTFDIHTGRTYSLAELFKPGADYVNRLSTLVQQQIESRQLPILAPFEGIQPNQPYYIADKALVLYYPLYELVPYVYGFPYFPISVYDIQDILDEEGPLGRMLY